MDLVEDDKADGKRNGDRVVAIEEEKVDGENEAEESDEGPDDQNECEDEQHGLNRCSVSQPESQLGGDKLGEESTDHFKSENSKETTQREETTIEMEMHHFLIPTHRETYQPFTRNFVPLDQDFPDKRIDRLRKEFKGATTIIMAEAARGVVDVFCGGLRDRVGPSGSIDVEGVSAGGIFLQHVTEIMALMQSRSIDYPEYYDPSDVIMDVFFCSALMAIYDDIVVNSAASQRSIGDVLKEYEFNDQILDYVTCDHPQPFGVSWVGVERVFCVWNMEILHYCTLVFIINDATIEVYDCNKRVNSIEKVDGLIKTHSDVVFNVA
ncbi:hypothetical protein K7X08_022921 [Anisodus acutangulus]|uniref:Uncharacterized protein n=1 Tax=Anisodus acutangulus TaxID=402998 RepID=A0A9Q1MGL0_9SOLA|nr:hypothetical protein K7X08_022921 [Anisodus acutangulus]